MPQKKNWQQKADLPKIVQGEASASTQGDRDGRRESARSETFCHGGDELFPDDPQPGVQGASPNPEQKRHPTIKSMAHKIARTLAPNRYGNKTPQTPAQNKPGASDIGSRTTSKDANIPELDEPPTSVKSGHVSSTVNSEPVTSDNDRLWHPLKPTESQLNSMPNSVSTSYTTSETEEEVTTGTREVLPGDQVSKQLDSGLERAAQRSRNIDSKSVIQQISGIGAYKKQVIEYKDLLLSKEKECKELQVKLDQRDMVHGAHVKAKLEDRDKTHQAELDKQQKEFYETLHQKQALQDRLTTVDAEITKLRQAFEKEEQKTATLSEQLSSANEKIEELNKLQETRLCEAHEEELKKQLDLFSKAQVKAHDERVDMLKEEKRTLQEEIENLKLAAVQQRAKIKQEQQEIFDQKLAAWQYEQDFKEERAAREKAVGTKNDQFGQFRVSIQKLSDRLQEYEVKLARAIEERDNLGKQLHQANNDFERTVACKSDEIKNLREQNAQVSAELDHYKKDFLRCQQQFETDQALHEHTRTELQHQIQTLKEKVAQTEDDLKEKAQLVMVQNLSFDEQLKKITQQLQQVTQDHKSKEKQLEILAHEKAMIKNELTHTQSHSMVLIDDLAGKTQELSTARQQGERLATELQEARERLETSLADTDRLHDEVMAKTAQVKQYKKQTDSYKTKLEEATAKLLRTQLELQQSKDLVKTMEEENQYQIEEAKARAESDKLAAETDMARLGDTKDELALYSIPQIPDLGECQGSGSYGSVHCIQLNGINCIAKRIHDILLGQGKEEKVSLDTKKAAYSKFYRECVLLSRMRHPNIVQFMGIHYGPQRDYGRELTLIMEHLYLNLEDCLKKYTNIEMWLKLSILVDVSQGLLHLHFEDIIHRDLTATNILLTTSFHAKIADLGVSKIINAHPNAASKLSMIPGTLGYMPPEALFETPVYSFPLDIFSFGVLMLYVLIQEYPQFYELSNVTYTGFQRGDLQVRKRIKWIEKLSPEDPMRQLICQCLQDEPQRRPQAADLKSTLTRFSQWHPKPFKDTIDMQRQLEYLYHSQSRVAQQPITPPRPLPRRQSSNSQGQK